MRNDAAGLLFAGRADDQVKLGGRRIELGRDRQRAARGSRACVGAAAAVRRTGAGNPLLVGYVDRRRRLRRRDRPWSCCATRCRRRSCRGWRVVDEPAHPDLGQGRPRRAAVAAAVAHRRRRRPRRLAGTEAWIADLWLDVLGAGRADAARDDFFDLGGGSLTAAQMVSRLRERFPEVTVGDLYEHPTVARPGRATSTGWRAERPRDRPRVRPTPPQDPGRPGRVHGRRSARWPGLRWLDLAAARLDNLLPTLLGSTWLPDAALVVASLVGVAAASCSPPGRMALTAAGARVLLRGVEPGAATRAAAGCTCGSGWPSAGRTSSARPPGRGAVDTWYARLLGAGSADDVDLHSRAAGHRPSSASGAGCSIEPEVDLTGHWVDGDVLHVGRGHGRRRGRGSAPAACSARAPSSARTPRWRPARGRTARCPTGEFWSGSPAERVGRRRGPWSRAGRRAGAPVARWPTPRWPSVVSPCCRCSPVLAGALLVGRCRAAGLGRRPRAVLPLAAAWPALVGLAVLLALVLRRRPPAGSLGRRSPATTRSHGDRRWQAGPRCGCSTRPATWLFPLYASALTPLWLRLLGARIGRDVEASTVLMIPRLTRSTTRRSSPTTP